MVLSEIEADSPQGNGRRIALVGIDMVLGAVDNIFVYPSLDIDRLKKTLSRTISRWPIVAGRVHVIDNEKYVIELSDKSIPFIYIENEEMEGWPVLPVVIDNRSMVEPFVESVPSEVTVDDPLVRFKVTRLVRSNEYILGVSFYHMIGDADTYIHFLSDLSCIYQDLQPTMPNPVFERHLWCKDDGNNTIDSSLMPLLRPLSEARKKELVLADVLQEHATTDPMWLTFSSEELTKIHNLLEDANEGVTIQDALTAYLIVTINKHVFVSDEEHIRRSNTIMNYRGISPSLAPLGQVDNSIIFILSDDFPDPLSLSSVAQTIRISINKARNEDFLRRWLLTLDSLMRGIHKEGKAWNYVFYPNEVWMNSNMKYDWAGEVDFGMKNQCRFHTFGLSKFRFRIFRLNPVCVGQGKWTRDKEGVEVSFRIPQGNQKDNFILAWKNDIKENFLQAK